MPKNRDLKRLTRSRMKKTGESYTAARAELVKKSRQNLAARAGASDRVVLDRTGRTWEDWVRLLDRRGARSMTHGEIARYLNEEQGVSGWWSQMVTVGYERIRGLRDIGQRRSGEYEASKSKTVPVAIARLFRAFTDDATREKWLPGVKWTVRTMIPDKTLRLAWADGTAVELYFVPKGPEKAQVAVQHRKLRTKSEAQKAKEWWGERLSTLAEIL